MKRLITTATAFIRRDFFIATSYKFQFIFHLFSSFFVVMTFYFLSKLISNESSREHLRSYGTDYFSFVLVGLAANSFLNMALTGFTERLRSGMTEGSLEMVFATSTPPLWTVIMPCLWGFFFEGIQALVIVGAGVALFDADLGLANFLGASLVVVLTLLAYSAFGLIAAGIVIIIKRGDPINWAFAHASALLAGAYFPVGLLPDWLQSAAHILPMTYAYHGLRMTLLAGASLSDVALDLAVLAGSAAVGLPIALAVCRVAINRARHEGTLGTF